MKQEKKNFFIGVVGENKKKNSNKDWIVKLRTNGTEIRYKIDTEVQINVLPNEILKCISLQIVIEPTKTKLNTYDGNNIKVLGKCKSNIETKNSNGNQNSCEFYVLNTQVDKKVATLSLGDNIKLCIVKCFLEINENNENMILINEFNNIFEEVGCIEGSNEIILKDNSVPNACATRKIPFSIEEPLKKELKKL